MGLNARVGDHEDIDIISVHLGACSGYGAWRRTIANTQNFNLQDMEGYSNLIKWTDQPFQLILNHSDCDGEYSIEQIPTLILELTEIKKLNIDDYDQCNKLLKLCDAALKQNKPIIFE